MTNQEPPALKIGTVIAGATVVAAVRQNDEPGLMPGLHVVTAYNGREYITWLIAWDGHRWVANTGHYFSSPFAHREAIEDMINRA